MKDVKELLKGLFPAGVIPLASAIGLCLFLWYQFDQMVTSVDKLKDAQQKTREEIIELRGDLRGEIKEFVVELGWAKYRLEQLEDKTGVHSSAR